MKRRVWAAAVGWLVVSVAPTMAATADHALHPGGAPAITGNPAADPTLPPRSGRPGRLLLRCSAANDHGRGAAEVFASAIDFDEGRQSFFLKRTDPSGREALYPLHGHFLDGGASGIFMVHDGRGTRHGETFRIDQSVNMGLVLLREASGGIRAILDVIAEESVNGSAEGGSADLVEYACRWAEEAAVLPSRLSAQAEHMRMVPNSGATPPSQWYRESDSTVLTCAATLPAGEYHLELRGAKIWPGHLGFLVVRAPGSEPPVGYNVHLLSSAGRLLIHAHSYPHRSRDQPMDTMKETETVIGGLLLVKTETGYAGWVGLVSSAADPYNISFSRDATMADYGAQGRTVVPPTPVTCQ